MNLSAEKKNLILEKIKILIPGYSIRLEGMEFDTELVGVGVFNVPSYLENEISETISNFSFDNFRELGVHLIPLVRDVFSTASHYPQYQWHQPITKNNNPYSPAACAEFAFAA